jgi:hypothetical protein
MTEETKKDAVTKPEPPSADKPKAPAAKVRRVLRIIAKQPTRWRIGRRFGTDPVDIDADDLDEAQIAALQADPLLVVSEHKPPKVA